MSPALTRSPAGVAAEFEVNAQAAVAAKLALAGKFAEAGEAAARSGEEAAIKLVELLYLRDHPGAAGYARIMNFLSAAPKWPLAETLMKRAERVLYANNEPVETVLAHFKSRKPKTSEGALALARAQLESGNKAEAGKLIRQVWSDPELSPELEKGVSSEFKSMLDSGDHLARMRHLVYGLETNAAIRAAKPLGGDYQAAAKTAQLLIRGVAGADKQYGKLSSAMRADPAVKYALVRYYRKLEKYSKARTVLAGVDGNAAGGAEAWWVERRIVARHSIGRDRADLAATAYQIARSHGFTSGEGAVEAEFLAGWIALRTLKEPGKALRHFERLKVVAETRTEKARAGYWLGRTYLQLGRNSEAASAFRDAAQHSTIYYGQLAREQLGLGNAAKKIASGEPSDAARARIDRDEVVRAFKLIMAAGSQSDLNMFLPALAARFNSADEMNAVARVVSKAGGSHMALRLAKVSGQRGIDIDSWGYPVGALPSWKQIGKPVEKALVFGLSRQESEFNASAGSTAGAQGLMQILPGTAKLIAKQHGLSYKRGALTGDPAYNVKLGAAHLGDLIAYYGGSYVLTLVAYNAGPRRAVDWLAEYGDFRRGDIDPVDWVESIPFQETRQYVQKVLQNTHVYRARLAPETAQAMSADLSRGAVKAFAAASRAEAGIRASECDGRSIADIIAKCE